MPTYFIQTYGCQMNYSDTERVETYLEALGYTKAHTFTHADLVIFNTCSIRQKAEDRIYGHMRTMAEIRRKKPHLTVAITGCMVRHSSSRRSKERDTLFGQIKELDIALRIEELPRLADLIRELDPHSTLTPIPEEGLEDYFRIKPHYTSQAQAFVPVSTGCDKFCTYCIVPFSRGRERSRTIEEIFHEAEKLVKNGTKEITLIGQTVNSYGFSIDDRRTKKFFHLTAKKEPFVYLLEKLDTLRSSGLERVRFTSPHPRDMSDQLISAMAHLPTQMPYLHLPIQSGDNRTLKRMNRPYTTERYREIIEKLRSTIPDISISTDVIVGFCDETDEEFENTFNFFKEMHFEHGYLAQYSERSGTFAARYMQDNIPPELKKERWQRLNDLLKLQSTKALSRFHDRTVHVLVENREGTEYIGRSEHFKTVQFSASKNLLGQLVPIRITQPREWILEGTLG